ncbi:MAG: GDSL-type esterase/lipase family protein, partial [Solirubrobacteraceae bacterium]
MAALGDSLTVALRACSPTAICPAASWSTGTSPDVNSHLLRLRAARPATSAQNLAVSGRKVSDLDRQAREAVSQGAEYVTILIGTNDICRESLEAMTPVATFRAQFAQAMSRLASGLPGARIFVASIPDPERLRALFAADATARSTWVAQDICRVFLQNPTSELEVDRARRATARQRLTDLDRQLEEVCALHAACIYDGGAVTAWRFESRHVTTADYYHLTVPGQAALAALTYPLAFRQSLPEPLPGPASAADPAPAPAAVAPAPAAVAPVPAAVAPVPAAVATPGAAAHTPPAIHLSHAEAKLERPSVVA